MNKLYLIIKNGIRRSIILIPAAILMTAIMAIAYMGGRTGSTYAVGEIPVGIIDRDGSLLSADMQKYLSEELGMRVESADSALSYEESMDFMTNRLLDAKIAVLVEIPEGLQENMLAGVTVKLEMLSLNDYANEAFMESYINNYMQRTALLAQAAKGDAALFADLLSEVSEDGMAVISQEKTEESSKKEKDESGLSLMMGFFTFVGFGYPMFMGMLLLEDKKNGTFNRIRVSSVKPAVYIGGISLSNLAVSALVVFGTLAMLAVSGMESNVPYGMLLFLMINYTVYCIGFNLLAAFLSKSSFAFMTVGVAYISIGNILGGAYFPLGENILSKFSVLVPQYFMLNTVRGLAEDTSYRYGANICVLILMTALIFLMAAVAYTRRENTDIQR